MIQPVNNRVGRSRSQGAAAFGAGGGGGGGTTPSSPLLSNPTAGTPTAVGTDGATVDTNQVSGILYWAVVTNGGSATAAQIKAGSGGNIVGAAGSYGNQTVTSGPKQTITTITGLSGSTTYQIKYLQTNAFGMDSNQSSVSVDTISSGNSQFLIYPFFIDVSEAASPAVLYYSNHINASDSTRGITFALKQVIPTAGGYIRAINDCYESEFRPGSVYAFSPSATTGTVTTFTDGNTRFNQIAAADKLTSSWDTDAIPVGGATGQDKALVWCEANTNGNFDLYRVRSGVELLIASDQAPGTSVGAPVLCTLTSTLAPGDKVRVKLNALSIAVSRIGHIQTYNSTGNCTNIAQHWIPITQTSRVSIWIQGSTAEGAFVVGPTGSAPEFVGGEAHQGPAGTYGQEFPSTTSWTKSGAPWTPAHGQWTEQIIMSRASTLYYNVGNPNIGTLNISYTMNAFGLTITNLITAGVAIDTGSMYWCMLPAKSAAWTQGGCTVAGVGVDKQEFTYASIVSSGFKYFGAPYDTASVATTYNILTPASFSICAYNKKGTPNTVVSRDTEDKSSNGLKNYEELTQFADPNAIGTTYGGSMVFFQDAATGPSAASITAAALLVP